MKYTRFEWWLPKLLCLIAACALWVYVMNEQNPQVENTYTVPVETRNLDRSLVATNVPSTVKVKVPLSAGAPESVPSGERESPAGSAPATTAKV